MQMAFVASNQHESLVDAMLEMSRFYIEDVPVSRDDVRANLLDNLLAPGSPVRLVVASDDGGAVAGLAAITLFRSLVDPSPGRGGQLLMKELYVRESFRGHGVGKALMSWIARHAIEQGCSRIDWNVSASNRPALAFYRALNAQHVAGRISYRLGGEALARLAGEGR